jgi:hypothetical protein
VIGKELADKIVSSPDREGGFKNLDLKVGGEGMRAFYDKIVPNVANDLLKKLGAGRVGDVALSIASGASREPYLVNEVGRGYFIEAGGMSRPGPFSTQKEGQAALDALMAKNVGMVQPGFDITPELRERAMQGLPLFKRGDAPAFSRASTIDDFVPMVRNAVTDRVRALTQSERTFNWLHRAFSTQYHKAQIDADYRPVFHAVQDYIADSAQFAMDASGLAPHLLPRLDDTKAVLRDTFGRNYKQADVDKVAEATFRATLEKKRLTPDDLIAQGLTDEQRKLFGEARDALDRSLDDLSASIAANLVRKEKQFDQRIVREAKYAPQEAAALYDAGVQAVQDRAQRAYNEALNMKRKTLRAYDKETKRAADEAKGPGGKAARKQERAEGRAQLVGQWDDAIAGLEERRTAANVLASKVRLAFRRTATLKQEGYAPLMRFGRYTVTVKDKAGATALFTMHETEAAAKKQQRVIAADPEFKDHDVSAGVMSQKRFELFQGISPETLSLFGDLLGMEHDPVFQTYLKTAISSRSAMTRLIHRKGTAGFDEDLTRVLAAFVTSNARLASRNYHYGEMVDAANAIPQSKGDVADEAVSLIKYVQNPQEEAQAVRGLLFVQYLGGSIAAALVNMTQPITMSLPKLAQYVGTGTATARLVNGMRLALRAGKADGTLGKALARAEREGLTAPHEIYQLNAEASRGFGSSPWWRRASTLWGTFFSQAERFNRVATFAAAHQIAEGMTPAELRKAGFENAYDFARMVVQDTQGIYNRGNRPNWARGPIGATLFTFKQFSISYIEFLTRLPRKQQALALAILLVAAGAEGLPFAQDLEDIIDAIGQSLGYGTNSRKTLRHLAGKILGDQFSGLLTSGVSSVTPIDVGQRLGVGHLVPGITLAKRSEPDKTRSLTDLLGPAGSLAQSLGRAAQDAMGGDFAGAGKEAFPLAVQNAVKGVGMWQTGQYQDTRGRNVVPVSGSDALLKGIGFQPQSVAEPQRRVGQVQQDITLAKTVESDIAKRWAEGRAEGDNAKVEAARQALRDWNEKNPDKRIRIDANQIQQRVRELRRERAERVTKSAPREMRAAVREELR